MASRPLPLTGGAGVRRARAGACLLALLGLAGCGGGAPASHQRHTGRLQGTVTRGPTSPVCREGTPCSEPAGGAKLRFRRDGVGPIVLVAKNGSYEVSLTPGVYTVAVLPQPSIGRGLEPSTVRVVAGRTRTVDFSIDTGIR